MFELKQYYNEKEKKVKWNIVMAVSIEGVDYCVDCFDDFDSAYNECEYLNWVFTQQVTQMINDDDIMRDRFFSLIDWHVLNRVVDEND